MLNYSKTNPCPVCGRYKTAYKNKCFGFITSDGKYAYCSRIKPSEETIKTTTVFTHTTYRHSINAMPSPSRSNSIQKGRTLRKDSPKDKPKPWNPTHAAWELEAVIESWQREGKWPY